MGKSDSVIECLENVLTEEDRNSIDYYLTSGTYGTVTNWTKQRIGSESDGATKKGRARYVMKRLFPPMEYYKKSHPFLYKTKVFIPAFVVYRWLHQGIKNRKWIIREIRAVLNKDK